MAPAQNLWVKNNFTTRFARATECTEKSRVLKQKVRSYLSPLLEQSGNPALAGR